MYNLEIFLDSYQNTFDSILSKNILENIEVLKSTSNTYTFSSDSQNDVLLKISDIITDFIIDCYEKNIIKTLVSNDYSYFSASEKEMIINKTLELLTSSKNEFIKILVVLKRRFHI